MSSNDMVDISVEVEALNMEGIQQNLLNYVEKNAKVSITESVSTAQEAAQSAEISAETATLSAADAAESARLSSENLGRYYTKTETDTLLENKADKATTLAGYGITDVYSKVQVDTSLADKANTSLDNLSSDGQMVIDSQNGTISNCVLEIPQNIKLELNNGVVTIKAGSIIPLAGSTYSTVTIANDTNIAMQSGFGNNIDGALFYASSSSLGFIPFTRIHSGDTQPTGLSGNTHIWFNTNDKNIYTTTDAGSTWNTLTYMSYPLAVCNYSSGVVNRFLKDSNGNDMIFNGAGFIGHHAFVYPNVKVLNPDGFNDDGTLKSNIRTTSSLSLFSIPINYNSDYVIYLKKDGYLGMQGYGQDVEYYDDLITTPYLMQYVKSRNLKYMYYDGNFHESSNTWILYLPSRNGTIDLSLSRFYQPIRTATVEMVEKIQSQVDTNTTAISGKQDNLVSGTNIKTINSTTVLGSGNFALADQSLSNLDSTGQMIVDSQNGTISNCILDIPQNIKMTLENNVLTLKSGSILTKTGSTYATVTTTADRTFTIPSNVSAGKYLTLCQQGNGTIDGLRKVNEVKSGTTDQRPAFEDASLGTAYFNTDTKQWNFRSLTEWNENWGVCYPICVVDIDENGVATFAKDSNGNDLIFNGCGFVGHHVFVYPNLRGLSPYRYNADGSLASIQTKSNSLIIKELSQNATDYTISGLQYINGHRKYHVVDDVSDVDTTEQYSFWYIKNENITGHVNSGSFVVSSECLLLTYSTTGTTVTDFTIRQPVRTATVEMVEKKADDSSVVKLTGAQTVAGGKTFTSNPVISNTQPQMQFVDSDFSKGTVPLSALRNTFFVLRDSSNSESGDMGTLFQRVDEYGNNYIAIVAFKNTSGSNDNEQLGIYYNIDGTSYATCPNPPAGDNSRKIATTKWVNDYFASITGYDATKTQTLKNVNGTLTWVDD